MTEQASRQALLEQSVHSALLEGLNVSSTFQSDSDKYVAGVISADELVEIMRCVKLFGHGLLFMQRLLHDLLTLPKQPPGSDTRDCCDAFDGYKTLQYIPRP